MYQKGNFYRNKSFYTNKGLTLQKKPQDPPKVINKYYVPIYKNYFLNTKQLMPYTPGVAYIEFKKRSNPSKTIGEFILDEVTAYGKNLTDITKIEIDPELDYTGKFVQVYTKVTTFTGSNSMFTPHAYGIWSKIAFNNESYITGFNITNNTKYTFEVIEGGWKITMLPGEIITTYEFSSLSGAVSECKNNINTNNEVSGTEYNVSPTTSPIKGEYKGYVSNETNALALKFVSGVYTNSAQYSMLQVKVSF